jgi:acyl-homoserine lactone synthase
MISCVSMATNHHFDGNLLLEQHKLRYREVVDKEEWQNIYIMGGMEFDRYDNLATEYFVATDDKGRVVGVTRSYPTTIPYMLSDAFTFLSDTPMPSNPRIFEASRLVLDRTLLSKEDRKPVIDQLVLAYMERGLQRGIDAYVGFMLPKIWDSTFVRIGWDIQWLGDEVTLTGTGEVVRAALMPVNKTIEKKMRLMTGLHNPILDFGTGDASMNMETAIYSHTRQELARAA